MEKIKDIQQWLIGYLVGLFDSSQIIIKIDDLILNDVWIDEFSDISSTSFYNYKNIYGILSSGSFKVNQGDFENFEVRLILYIQNSVTNNSLNWVKASEYLYNLILLKKQYFNLTSNDLDDFWFGIINDNELRKDGLPSNLTSSAEFLDLLKHRTIKGNILLNIIFQII